MSGNPVRCQSSARKGSHDLKTHRVRYTMLLRLFQTSPKRLEVDKFRKGLPKIRVPFWGWERDTDDIILGSILGPPNFYRDRTSAPKRTCQIVFHGSALPPPVCGPPTIKDLIRGPQP